MNKLKHISLARSIFSKKFSFAQAMILCLSLGLASLTHAESPLSNEKPDIFVTQYEASLWLLKMSARMEKFVKNDVTRLEILRQVYIEAQKNKLDPNFVLSVMHVESRFNPQAISSAGAQGLMQVMPFWKKELGPGRQENLRDIKTNIRYGCKILKIYMAQEKGNPVRALARYNGSTGRTWYPTLVLNAWKSNWIING